MNSILSFIFCALSLSAPLFADQSINASPQSATARPHENCYWVIPGKFLAGEHPVLYNERITRDRIKKYLDAGITFFINLTESHELKSYQEILFQEARTRNINVQYVRFAIRDNSIPTLELMDSILSTIDNALRDGHNVYVHCWAGIGRTGTVVGCYLRAQGMAPDHALAHLAHLWKNAAKSKVCPRTPYTDEQVEFVKNYNGFMIINVNSMHEIVSDQNQIDEQISLKTMYSKVSQLVKRLILKIMPFLKI